MEQCPHHSIIGENLMRGWSKITSPLYDKIICTVSGGADSDVMLDIIWKCDLDKVLGEDFNQTVLNVFNSYHNKNYLLVRNHTYENEGRLHNEKEAKAVRKKIMDKLDKLHIEYEITTSSEDNCEIIANEIVKEINQNEQ